MDEKIGQEFMQKTSRHVTYTAQQRGVEQPPLEWAAPQDADRIPLPRPEQLHMPVLDLRTTMERRRTVRKYGEEPLRLEELSYLLWLTQGVQEITSRPVTMRTVPSAGARHAFETFILVNRVEGVPPGLYRFLASEHALLLVDRSDGVADRLTEGCQKQAMVYRAAVTFFWVAVAERMVWRYGQRGYRYLHLDAGHVCQNLYLAAESLDCGTCAIAAFDDDLLNAALTVDGQEMFAVYVAAVGKKTIL